MDITANQAREFLSLVRPTGSERLLQITSGILGQSETYAARAGRASLFGNVSFEMSIASQHESVDF